MVAANSRFLASLGMTTVLGMTKMLGMTKNDQSFDEAFVDE
jgi:hypothetical protein